MKYFSFLVIEVVILGGASANFGIAVWEQQPRYYNVSFWMSPQIAPNRYAVLGADADTDIRE